MDTIALIIVICIIIPAVLAFSVCAIIFYSRRNKNRKLHRQRESAYEYHPYPDYHHSCERIPSNNHIIHFSYNDRYQVQPRRLREPSPAFDQSPPSYNHSINGTRRLQLPLFSTIHTTPSITHVQRAPPVSTIPSVYSAMPPSYAQIFLTPQTANNP